MKPKPPSLRYFIVGCLILCFLPPVIGQATAADSFLDPRLVDPDADYRVAPPDGYRAIYVSGYTAGTPRAWQLILDGIKGTEIDALVVDMRDMPGRIFYPSKIKVFIAGGGLIPVIEDPAAIVEQLRELGIRSIARIAVFSDDYLPRSHLSWAVRDGRDGSAWEDKSGFTWLDPFSNRARRALVQLSVEVAQFGFDEIQFDYVRFPTYQVENAYFPNWPKGALREDAIVSFLRLAREELAPYNVDISADVFGFSAWNDGPNQEGQTIERMLPFIDSLCPMYYPSHFGWNFMRQPHPATRDRRIMSEGVTIARRRVGDSGVLVIPYLQGFKLGVANWGPSYVRGQIEAAMNAGADGYIIWNADNKYGVTFQALRSRAAE